MRYIKTARVIAGVIALLMGTCAYAKENTQERIPEVQRIAKSQSVGHYGMTPIVASQVNEGVYPVTVDSNSPYFKVTKATLYVESSGMRLDFTIASKSYLYVFQGTAKEAKKADSKIEGTVTEAGETVFSITIDSLNAPIDCAAYSKRKKKWYSRTLLVDAASLPASALKFELPDYEALESALFGYGSEKADSEEQPQVLNEMREAIELDLDDGDYSIEVNMTGGSGRASVSSPTKLVMRDGKAYAELLWSSTHYDYMIVEGERYENLNTDGGSSTFEIPITVIDAPMIVIADTTAMGEPVEIEYTLIFYEDTIGDTSLIPQVAAKRVLVISLVLIAIGAILNYFLKRERG